MHIYNIFIYFIMITHAAFVPVGTIHLFPYSAFPVPWGSAF